MVLDHPSILHAAQHRRDFNLRPQCGLQCVQLLLDAVKRQFRDFKKHQARRLLSQDLAAKLAADRAARTGDHHHLVTDIRLMPASCAWRHRITAQKILDADIIDLINARLAGHDIIQTGHGLQQQRIIFQRFQNRRAAPCWLTASPTAQR